MTLSSDQIRQILADADHPLGLKELLRLAGLHPGQQTALKRALRDMVRHGHVAKEGKRFLLEGRPSAGTGVALDEAEDEGPDGGSSDRPTWDSRPPRSFGDRGPRAGSGGFRAPGPAAGGSEQGRFRPRARSDDRGPRPDRGFQGGRGPSAERPQRGGRDEGRGGFGRERQGRGFDRGAERGFDRGGRRDRFAEEGLPTVEGILHVHRDGFGFVHPVSGEGENIFLPPHEAQRALDNDRVVVEVAGRPGRFEGRLVRVVDRRRELAVGTYHDGGRYALVYPTDNSLPGPIRVPFTQMAQDGDLVKVRLGVGAHLLDPSRGLFGEVAGSLGKPGEPSAEVLGIAFSQGFSDEFPPEAMDEADRYEVRVTEEEARGEERRDLRAMPLITIDGEDARDFDDAVYTEDHAGGWRLVVAIADVSHYVRERRPLDDEAFRRATSVYLPNRVLPMLPERLSNGICSLRPDEDRLCMVADMTFDRHGQRRSYELYPAVMRSAARCTYNEVQDVLDGKDVPHRNAFKPHFERLMALARALMKMRKDRGAIDFDMPEHKVVLGDDGLPERMDKRERKDSHRLIEECMLAANEAVAKFFQDEGLPTVYRFHGEPDPEKLAAFAALAEAYGFKMRFEDGVSSKELDAFISQLTGHPEQRALNQLLLRSMMQAVYTASRVGHYGLAAEHYLHFTSPIRRYPDLLVHRLLKSHWSRRGRKPTEAQLEREEARLEDMAVQCSERERAAMQVERDVVAFYAALLMKDRVGEEFAATVAAITEFGFFVELDEVHVEGLVKSELLGPGAKLDKRVHSLVYPNGRRVRVGQKLRVRLVSANTTSRKIDFEPLQFEGEAPLQRGEDRALQRRRPEWREAEPRQHAKGHERAGRPGRRERETARAGQFAPRDGWQETEAPRVEQPRFEAARPEAGGPRGRFSREGRREEAAPARAGSRWQRAPVEPPRPESQWKRQEEAPHATKGPKRRMFVRPPEPPALAEATSPEQPPPPAPVEAREAHRPPVQEAVVPAPVREVREPEAPPSVVEAMEAPAEASPHPGFDRLRALAAQGKRAAPAGGRKTAAKAAKRAVKQKPARKVAKPVKTRATKKPAATGRAVKKKAPALKAKAKASKKTVRKSAPSKAPGRRKR